ncbi:hypothetical protein [Gallintestinimicrobium sp.]|uniref:hypothetical protein n=1 Tax=Gallintestinimicrobium sp. TaxID=2981655 RepID=UPI00399C1A52
MKAVKQMKPGQKLMLRDPQSENKNLTVAVKVIKQYPHHVLCATEKGIRMCVTNAELYALGRSALMDADGKKAVIPDRTERKFPKLYWGGVF